MKLEVSKKNHATPSRNFRNRCSTISARGDLCKRGKTPIQTVHKTAPPVCIIPPGPLKPTSSKVVSISSVVITHLSFFVECTEFGMKHRYSLRPRTPASPLVQRRKRSPVKSPQAETRETPSISAASPSRRPPDGCRSCRSIPGPLAPLLLARMSAEERHEKIDASWREIEAERKALTSVGGIPSRLPASSHVLTVTISARAHIGHLEHFKAGRPLRNCWGGL